MQIQNLFAYILVSPCTYACTPSLTGGSQYVRMYLMYTYARVRAGSNGSVGAPLGADGMPHMAASQSISTSALECELGGLPPIPPPVDELSKTYSGGKPMRLQDELRRALRHRLDITVRPVITDSEGNQTVMEIKDMISVYNRRRDHMLGYRASLQWALAQTKKTVWSPAACPEMVRPLETPRIAIAFWHSTDGAPEHLPHAFSEGLASCVRNSGLTVFLLSYQRERVVAGGLPQGVHLQDANYLLAWPVFARLMLERRVQHLSDYLRLLALVHGIDGTGAGGGWMIDGDTIWLKQAPLLSVACPPHLGHWFASQQACRGLRGHDKAGIATHWRTNYLKTPGDFLHVAFPIAVPSASRLARGWLDRMETDLLSSGKMQYTHCMGALQECIKAHGMEGAIASASAASPFRRLRAVHAGVSAKRHLFDRGALTFAMCVNNIWQSSMKCSTGRDAYTLADAVPEPGSMWTELSELWKGIPHRRVRHKAACPETKACPVVSKPACPVVSEPRTPEKAACPEKDSERDADLKPGADNLHAERSDLVCSLCMGLLCSPVSLAPELSAGAGASSGGVAPVMADKCVGESRWGDSFLWRTIMDMP